MNTAKANPQIFTSLLFYYGMLTIKGTRGDKMILGIPNLDVGTKISIVIKNFL